MAQYKLFLTRSDSHWLGVDGTLRLDYIEAYKIGFYSMDSIRGVGKGGFGG